MNTRPLHDPSRIAPAALAKLASNHTATIDRVASAVEKNAIVVVGMAQNPHVKNVRAALKTAGFDAHYIEIGSYFAGWRERLAIKLWSGWPTFPQVFVRGVLIGGEDLTVAALADGTLRSRFETKAATPITASA
jgi:glutaredoxin-related protein